MGSYDIAVVGLGAMGSAAAYHLARRGVRVLGLDAHPRDHTRGSFHGESRIIRTAYLEHPDYVPLLLRAYALWEALEAEAGRELLRRTGGLFIGRRGSRAVAGALRSAREHGLPHELLDAPKLRRRYPALRPLDDEAALFEANAGILFPEGCVAAHLAGAEAAGATLRHGAPVRAWRAEGEGVEVATDAGRYRADRLVLAPGAWLTRLLPELPAPLRVERVSAHWLLPTRTPELFASGALPIYIWETEDAHSYYGFPHLERPGAKVGQHHTGAWVDPDAVDREPSPADADGVRAFVRSRIPALDGAVAASSICLYTNTPDEHFIVDRHPELPRVAYASACSGHGFKFASVIGELLADLATGAPPRPEAAFLRADRFETPSGG